MADPTSGDAVAQIIAASGTAVAAVIGAVVLWPTRRRRERAAVAAAADPEDGSTRLRERLTALETRVGVHEGRLDRVEEDVALLRAQEIAIESLARDTARRRRST